MEEADLRKWCEEVLPLVGNDQPPPEDLPGGGLALLSADTDRTQSYVFQSARLPEIRGASMLLDQLNRKKLLDILHARGLPTANIGDETPGCIIFNGGGSLLALVPPALADKIAADIETLYPREAGTATITAVWRNISVAEARGAAGHAPLPPDLAPAYRQRLQSSADLGPVQRLMRRQNLALRQRKQAKTIAPHFDATPYARLCNSCGRRPVVATLAGIAGEAPRYLCQVCHANDRRGRAAKSSWNVEFEKWCQTARQQVVDAAKAEDLGAIGKVSKGYIGFIHADGNGIGRLLEQAGSLDEYGRLSRHLAHAMETAVYEALYANLYDGQGMLPFEIITIGGDDVLLIVPAHAALPVARHVCAAFSARLAERLPAGPAPTMSAGVVIAQDSNPIYFISDLAHQLLKSAKQRTGQAALDFMVLKSQSTLATNLKDVRRSAFLRVQHEQNKERCLLTGRPYTLEELDKVLEGTRRLRRINLSPGQLHEMRRQFQQGRFPGLFYYLYQRTRLGRMNRHYAQALGEIEADWGMVEPAGAPPWRAVPEKASDGFTEFDTPFLDMLTLREFVAAENGAGAAP